MSRLARAVVPREPHHVIQRGNRRVAVFHAEQDCQADLRLLREYARYLLWHGRKPRHHEVTRVEISQSGAEATDFNFVRKYDNATGSGITLLDGERGIVPTQNGSYADSSAAWYELVVHWNRSTGGVRVLNKWAASVPFFIDVSAPIVGSLPESVSGIEIEVLPDYVSAEGKRPPIFFDNLNLYARDSNGSIAP